MLFSPDSSLQHLNNIFTSKKKTWHSLQSFKKSTNFHIVDNRKFVANTFFKCEDATARNSSIFTQRFSVNRKTFFEWSFNFIVDFCDAIFVSFQLEKMLKFFFVFPRWYQIRKLFIFLKWFFNLASQTQNLGAQMKVFKVKIAVNFLLRLWNYNFMTWSQNFNLLKISLS